MPAYLPPVRLETNDWAEGLRLSCRHFYPGTVTASPPARSIDLRLLQVGPLTAGILRFGSETAIEVPVLDSGYHVNVALSGAVESRSDGVPQRVTRELGAVYRPDVAVRLRGWQTGTEEMLAIKLDRDALELHLRQLLGREFVGSIRLRPTLDLRHGRGAQWWHLVEALVHGLRGDDMIRHPQANATMVSGLMSALLLACDHQFRGELDAPGTTSPPAVIRRAVDYIQNHAFDPLTVPGIAEAAGASVRALQAGFRIHLGTTPRRYLTAVRLDRVHRDLLAGSPESTSVATAASFWGFAHLGRFASLYRAQYGEFPSTTLRDGYAPGLRSAHEEQHATDDGRR